MKRYKSGYDLQNTVGKYVYCTPGAFGGPFRQQSFGKITRATEKRVYYAGVTGKETYLNDYSLALVEVTPEQVTAVSHALEKRGSAIKAVEAAFDKTIADICDAD